MRTDTTYQIILILDNDQTYFKAALNIVRNAPDTATARAMISEYVYSIDRVEKFREEMGLHLPDVIWQEVVSHFETKLVEGVNNDLKDRELSEVKEYKELYSINQMHDLVRLYSFLSSRIDNQATEAAAEELRGACYDLRTIIEKSAFGRSLISKGSNQ